MEHAWKTIPGNDLLRYASVNDGVAPVLRRVSDTVLTQPRLDRRMFRVPLGRLLVRVTHAAQHRFAQPATNELHAQR